MNTVRMIPIFFLVIGTVLTVSITRFRGFSISETYIRIIFVAPVFYMIGIIVRHFVTGFILWSRENNDSNNQRGSDNQGADKGSDKGSNEGLDNIKDDDTNQTGNKSEDLPQMDPIAFKRVRTKESLNKNSKTLEK